MQDWLDSNQSRLRDRHKTRFICTAPVRASAGFMDPVLASKAFDRPNLLADFYRLNISRQTQAWIMRSAGSTGSALWVRFRELT